MADGRIQLLSSVGGERGYLALTSDVEGTRAIRQDGDESVLLTASEELGEARISLTGEDSAVDIAWSPAGPMLEFEMGAGPARVHGVAASVTGTLESLSGPGVLWDLPAAGASLLRTAWAATAKGSLTVLLALRPEGAGEHGQEIIGAARMMPNAEPYGYVEPLLSTEYDAAGAHTRATLELWLDGDDHPPERGAGLRICGSDDDGPGGHLRAARFGWSMGGNQAVGAYEILRP
jgi:hypothetical protein